MWSIHHEKLKMTIKSKPDLTVRQKKFLTLFKDLGCNISATCAAMKMGRQTFYNWKDASEEFTNEVEDTVEGMIDYVESKLMLNIKAGHEKSIFFFLRTRAKHRGYVERQETVHEGEMTFLDMLKRYSEETAVDPLDEQG